VTQSWPATYKKYHEREIGIINEASHAIKKLLHRAVPELKLTFRTTSILPLSQERSIKDPMAIHLFYIQAVFNVLTSNYPCEPDVAGLSSIGVFICPQLTPLFFQRVLPGCNCNSLWVITSLMFIRLSIWGSILPPLFPITLRERCEV